MKFLLKSKGKVAHLWTGTDTLCRMWSTGGIAERSGYAAVDDAGGRPLCQMCKVASGEQAGDREVGAVVAETERSWRR